MRYTVTRVEEPLAPLDEHWTVRTNDLITGVFWFESDAYAYVAYQVKRRVLRLHPEGWQPLSKRYPEYFKPNSDEL